MEIISLKDFVGGDESADVNDAGTGGECGARVRDGVAGLRGGAIAKTRTGAVAGERRITNLKPGLKDPNRVNVFIDEEFAFSLDIAQVVDYGVKIGRCLSEAEFEELKAASEFGKLYQRALEWVLTRPHSVRETEDYLRRVVQKRRAENRLREANRKKLAEEKMRRREMGETSDRRAGAGMSSRTSAKRVRSANTPSSDSGWAHSLKTKPLPEISAEQTRLVIERLIERGYLDDVKFAKFYVENRFVKKGVSRRRLEMELRKKGLDTETIAEALREAPRDEEAEIRKIIAKKAGKYDNNKLIQYLIRQGFDYQLVQNLVAHETDSQSWE